MPIENMLITTEINENDPGSIACVAKLGTFEFRQLFSKAIKMERIQTYFEIQAEVMYEKYQEDNHGTQT
jgi:tRNA(Ile2) C34 agmatinyltransferase TiaS